MNTYDIYYLQTNCICILALAATLILQYRDEVHSTETRFHRELMAEITGFCLSDIAAAVLKNAVFPGVRWALMLANMLYMIFPLLITVTWSFYVEKRMERYGGWSEKGNKIIRILIQLGVAAVLTTPWSGFCFTLDEQNLYHRAIGAYIAPVLSYLSLAHISVKLWIAGKKSQRRETRRETSTLVVFAIPALCCSVLQIIFYGTTLVQVGYTMGFLMVYVMSQHNMISRDELTGLNNRREMERQLDLMPRWEGRAMAVMIDIDDFKSINDNFGHAEGDYALKEMADCLMKACRCCKADGDMYFLSRYGGDEFVLLLRDYAEGAETRFRSALQMELGRFNKNSGRTYSLGVSIGTSVADVHDEKEASQLIQNADEAMYKEKKEKQKHKTGISQRHFK